MHTHENTAAAPGAAGQEKAGMMAMGTLLADMNHDIRTSMNGVRGMLDLLLDTGLTPSQQEYARTAQYSVDSLLESLERIVDMSLIESNSFRFNQAPFDLFLEVRAALAGKPSGAQGKGIELSIAYPPAVRLNGDAARLREAFSALADLALGCAAGETMSLTTSASGLPGGMCRVTLEANVPQSSEESGALASMLGGAGPAGYGVHSRDLLGMAVCTQLVHRMKGTIEIDRAHPPATRIRMSIDLPFAPQALTGLRALVLCGEPGRHGSLLAPLARLGAQAESFSSAGAGLAAVENAARNGTPYRLVAMASRLDGMDAGILAAAIRHNPAHRDVLFVLLGDEGAAPADGFAGSLKPSASGAEIESALLSLCMAEGGPNSAAMSQAVPGGTANMPAHADCTVLVADDNPVNQQVAARMLEKLGCKAEVASDGMQAIEMHHWKRFDLILMDCEMPVLDGLEATQRIRATEGSGRRTPIIALTACTGQGEQERCLAAGMDDFLSKPIRPPLLGDILARWLPRPAAHVEQACEDELEEVKNMFGADFADLAALYQNDGPPRLATMREAAAAGDCVRLAKVSHALAGSCASIGATGLSSLCMAIETSARAGSLEDFGVKMEAVESEYRRVCGKLQSLVKP